MFLHLCVILFTAVGVGVSAWCHFLSGCRGGLCPEGGPCPVGVCKGGVCLGGPLSWGSLVWGSLSRVDLRGLSGGPSCTVNNGRDASYWIAFLRLEMVLEHDITMEFFWIEFYGIYRICRIQSRSDVACTFSSMQMYPCKNGFTKFSFEQTVTVHHK